MSLSHLEADHLREHGIKTAVSLWTPYRYAIPIVAVAIAAGITRALDTIASESPNLFLFFIAIVVSAWFAGAGPGWLSVFVSIVTVNYFFMPPIHVLDFSLKDLPWFAAFIGCAVATNTLSLKRRRMEQELLRAHNELKQRVTELRQTNERLIAAIAERTRTEAALRETQNELARAERIMTIGELTASIAHEISQPLAAVVSNAAAALNWLQRNPPDISETTASVVAIKAAGDRAGDIITRIRSLIKRGAPERATLNINDVVDSVLATVMAEQNAKDVVIERSLEPDLPVVLGDRIQLQQLVWNLVNNAIEAMADVFDRPRELVVCTRRIPDDGICIAIKDSGSGLADADITRLFQPFYSTKAEGTGMGLSICRSIAEAHGGGISAVSRSPFGTVFCVHLPAARQ